MDEVSEIVAKIRAEQGEAARKRLGLSWTPSDGIVVPTEIRLGWRDRIRALFGRPIHVRTEVWVEQYPNRHAVEVSLYVAPLWPSAVSRAVEPLEKP